MATFTGNNTNNSLTGGSGTDLLQGLGGNDTLVGLASADTLDGGTGVDSLVGGKGMDTYVVDFTASTESPGSGQWDTVVELADGNIDTISLQGPTPLGWRFFMPAEVENLTSVSSSTRGVDVTGNSLDNQITGTMFRDSLWGETGNDTLLGGEGNDYLTGNDGVDSLVGGAGNDELDGGLGWEALAQFDTLAGGAGNDFYLVGEGDVVTENAGEGIDSVIFSAMGNYTLPDQLENLFFQNGDPLSSGIGNSLDNYLFGPGGTVVGLAGNDTLSTIGAMGSGGMATLIGGSGNDTYFVFPYLNAFDQVVEEDNGGFDIVVFTGSSPLTGSTQITLAENGNIEGIALADISSMPMTTGGELNGNSHDNFLSGSNQQDYLWGGGGNDVLRHMTWVDTSRSTLNAYFPSDIYSLNTSINVEDHGREFMSGNLLNAPSIDTLVGGTGNDIYFIDEYDVVIENANGGNDTLNVVGHGSSYALIEQFENLILDGDSTIEDITGNGVANQLIGNREANRIEGLAGNDTLDGGRGADTLIGGAGDDRYIVDSGDVIFELDGEGTDTAVAGSNFTLATGTENLVLDGIFSINGYGNMDANSITGNSARNILDGDEGADTLTGGGGNDKYIVDDAGDVVVEAASAGINDRVFSSVSFTLASNIEALVLTGFEETNGTGNTLANTLKGNGAANLLNGGDGYDSLFGGSGADTLLGGNGNDALAGGNGQDSVNGAYGDDTLSGGSGSDLFVFSSVLAVSGNTDHITDFLIGSDHVQLHKSVFAAVTTDTGVATLNAASFVNGSSALDAGDRIIFNAANGSLYYDADGTGSAVMTQFAVIDNGAVLTAGSFIVV